jgi:hypothetical protein
VDGLHRKAIVHLWDDIRIEERILELHGTLHVSLSTLRILFMGVLIGNFREFIVNSVTSPAETHFKTGYPPAIPVGRHSSTA